MTEATPPAPPVEPGPPSFWRAIGITFETCIRNARTCFVLVSVYAVLNGAASAVGNSITFRGDPAGASAGELIAIIAAGVAGIGTLLLVTTFIAPPTFGGLSLVGSAAVFGDSLDTEGIVRRVLDRALEAIGVFVLTLLILAAVPVAIAVLAALIGVIGGALPAIAVFGVLMILFVVPAIYVSVRLLLAVPVVVREGLGPVAALRRSWDLVGGAWWWIFGVEVVVFTAGGILSSIATGVFSLGQGRGGLMAVARSTGAHNVVLSIIGNTAGAVVSGTLMGVALGVIYAARAQVRPPAELPLPDTDQSASPQ